MEQRKDFIEHKMYAFTNAYNTLVDDYNQHSTNLFWTKEKNADLEDRSRRHNLKFRGIPKSVTTADLIAYLQQLFKVLIPNENPQEFIIDST